MSFDTLTGVDLERDFLAHLEGDMIPGVTEYDHDIVYEKPKEFA